MSGRTSPGKDPAREKQAMREGAAPPLPFRRPIPVGRLSRGHAESFDISPHPDEIPEIARFMGLEALNALRFRGELVPVDKDGWRIDARLEAEIVQGCVVTLAPVTNRIDAPVTRSYVPEEEFALPAEIDINPEAEDDPDPYGRAIDPGALAMESLALLLDPYPHAPDAARGAFQATPPGAEPLPDGGPRPFAGLAVLKEKFDKDR